MVEVMVSDNTAPFDVRKPRFYHNLNWDIISGEHSALKGSEISEDFFDMMNLGYRLPQDLYEDITISSFLFALERGRGRENKKAEDLLMEQFNRVITWKNNEPILGYQPKQRLSLKLLGNPFQAKPGLTIPRLKPDIQPNNVTLEKYGTTRTEKIQDIFHRYEREVIKPYYYPMIWVRHNNGFLHLQCSKIV